MPDLRSFSRLGAIVLALSAAACAAAPSQRPVKMGPTETGPGTLAAARKYLEGRWALLSFEVFPPGRSPITLKGSGTLVYDEFGNLQMEIRTDAETAQALERAGIPVPNGVISNTGRTAVDMQARTLTYMFAGAPPPGAPGGPLASNRPRHWQVDGDVLTLTTRADDGSALAVGRWKKQP